jgi:hypothetical protein
MSLLSLTANQLTRLTPLQITDLIAAGTLGSNTGVTFTNSGKEFLAVTVAAGGSTCTIKIGTTVEGQAVTSLTPTITASKTSLIGPFPSDVNAAGGIVEVDFGTPANVTVSLLQFAGVV